VWADCETLHNDSEALRDKVKELRGEIAKLHGENAALRSKIALLQQLDDNEALREDAKELRIENALMKQLLQLKLEHSVRSTTPAPSVLSSARSPARSPLRQRSPPAALTMPPPTPFTSAKPAKPTKEKVVVERSGWRKETSERATGKTPGKKDYKFVRLSDGAVFKSESSAIEGGMAEGLFDQ